MGERGFNRLRFQSMWPSIGRILPEIIDLAVGMSAKEGAVGEAEVVLQDSCYQARKARVTGKHCQVETVLAVAIRVIEADSFRRVAEPIGLLLGVEVDDRNVLVHRPTVFLMAADGYVQIFIAFGFARLYETSTQVVLRIFLFSYNKNSDEYSVKINKNSDDNPWQTLDLQRSFLLQGLYDKSSKFMPIKKV